MYSKTTTFLIVAFIAYANAAKLPPFLKACPRQDNKCALEVASKGINELLDGYKPFKMRSVNPFKFDKLDLSTGQNLKLVMTDGKVSNLKSVSIKDVDIDMDNGKVTFKFIASPVLDSEYEVNGKILILPVQGKGKCHIELDDMNIEYTTKLTSFKKDDKEHYRISDDIIKMTIGAMRLQFENLFNGDKALGEQLNVFINENWQEVEAEFHDGISALVITIVHQAFDAVFDNVPVDDLIA